MMFIRKTGILLVSVLMLAALAFTGCSTGSDDDEPNPPTEWTLVSGAPFGTTNVQKVVFGTDKFVATGNSGTAWYSTDGITWTESSSKTALGSSNLSGLTFGNGKFLTTGGSSNNKDWAYSSDGNTWTATGSLDENFNAKGLAYGKTLYLIGGSSGRIAYSSDLSSWITLAAATTTFTGSNGFVSAIAFDGSKWVAGGSNYGHMAYSTDGTTWTGITETEEIFNGWINGLAYGGGKFVAVGNINNLTGIAWANASDITKWTAVAVTPFPDATFTEIGAIAYGNGYFVAIGSSSSAAAYSPDGITWTKIVDTKFGTNAINGITYGNGKFVIVGGDGTIAYSVPE